MTFLIETKNLDARSTKHALATKWRKAAGAGLLLTVAYVGVLAAPASAQSAGIHIDTEAARRTIDAALNPKLTRAEAIAIADLPGNKGLVQQAREFGIPETRDTFAAALLSAAHGDGADSAKFYNFQEVQANAASGRAALATLAANPNALNDWITQRIAPFVPVGISLTGVGYLIAGGPGAGFSPDDGGVYVNLSREKGEMGVVRLDFSHEFYHGVQHAAQARAGTLNDFEFDDATYAAMPSAIAKQCYATRQLFGKLMVEGTAGYVGDIALFPTTGEEALSVRAQREASLSGNIGMSISLLEIGLAAMTADDPVSEKSVYGMGFLHAGQLYYDVSYIMARAIAQRDGDAAIGRLIAMPGDAFVRRYIALSDAPGSKLPKLGERAHKWAERTSCP